MKRPHFLVSLFVVLTALSVASCKDDSTGPGPDRDPYKALDGPRDDVLYNLQLAYNNRNLQRYDELLDADFIFYFSNTDVTGGKWTAGEYWDRQHERAAHQNMFDPGFSKPGVDPVTDIDLILTYASGDDKWTQKTPEDQVKYPGEVWWEKIVTYNINVKAGYMNYIGNNKQASFVLRWATVGDQSFWRIVTWRDDTGTQFDSRGELDRVARVEPTSWGQVKALYAE